MLMQHRFLKRYLLLWIVARLTMLGAFCGALSVSFVSALFLNLSTYALGKSGI
jgi:hypothetical protein